MGRRKMEDTQQVALRLPTEAIRRADAYAASLSAEHPGMIFTRTDAMRIILVKHLPPFSASSEPEPEPASTPAPKPGAEASNQNTRGPQRKKSSSESAK
jgi:hypothetical protein